MFTCIHAYTMYIYMYMYMYMLMCVFVCQYQAVCDHNLYIICTYIHEVYFPLILLTVQCTLTVHVKLA